MTEIEKIHLWSNIRRAIKQELVEDSEFKSVSAGWLIPADDESAETMLDRLSYVAVEEMMKGMKDEKDQESV